MTQTYHVFHAGSVGYPYGYRYLRTVRWSGGYMDLIGVLRRVDPCAVAFTPHTCKTKFPNVGAW